MSAALTASCAAVTIAGFQKTELIGTYARDDARLMYSKPTYWKGSDYLIYWCSKNEDWKIASGTDYGNPDKIGPDNCYSWASTSGDSEDQLFIATWIEWAARCGRLYL